LVPTRYRWARKIVKNFTIFRVSNTGTRGVVFAKNRMFFPMGKHAITRRIKTEWMQQGSSGTGCLTYHDRPTTTTFGKHLAKIGVIGHHIGIMPHGDFDVSSLSRYLHLSPQQVSKLAERGKLPGRKVSGDWRFAKADIHHWLEQRIGLSDDTELLEVENVLQQSLPPESQQEVSIGEMLPIEAIAVPLAARTRSSVIDAMVELASQTGWLWDTKEMAQAVKTREDMHPTALENGVALLHPRRPLAKILAQPFLALGCTTTGIPFGNDVPMTDVFFLICSTEDRGHLRTLARLSRILASPGFLNTLHQVADATEAHQLIVETEANLRDNI
jgi:PTS system nitrogen regulatory IIA component